MTSAAFTSLSATVLEDTMELSSSPAGNQFDGDIDIDLGDYPTAANLTDDERMLDDGEPARPATATDEMMDDDEHTLTSPVNEEVMQDGPDAFEAAPLDLPDEELIDYDDDDFQDQAQVVEDTNQTTQVDALSDPTEVQATEESVDEEIVPNPEENTVEEPSASHVDTSAPVEPAPQIEVAVDPKPAKDESVEVSEEQSTAEATQAEDESTAEVPEATNIEGNGESKPEEDETHNGDAALKPLPQLPGTLDTNLGHISDGPPTPTDTGLHPMTLKFEDYEMPLFKSRAQPNGLLKDDNLANVSLADLIHNCRERLSTKLGEGSVPEGQDLVLNFDHMGVMLFEGSRSASSVSLNEVIDVYITLHQNDDVVDIPPLLLSLRPQPFSTMFDGLKRAAAEGTGMSNFLQSTDRSDRPQNEEVGETAHQAGEYSEYGNEQYDTYAQEEETGNYEFDLGEVQDGDQEQYEEEGDGQQPEREYTNAEEPQENYEDNTNFQHEHYPGPEDDLSQYEDDEYYEEPTNTEQDAQGQTTEDNNVPAAVQPKSTASSDTVRGDLSNDNTACTGDGQDDFLDFFEADAIADAPDASADTWDPEPHDNAADDEPANAEAENVTGAQEDQVALPGESEDFLNEDFVENTGDGNDLAADPQHDYDYDETGADLLQFTEETDVQTDNLGQEHDDLDQNEDSEQFHTAFDLLDGTEDTYDDNMAGEAGEAQKEEEYDEIGFDDDDDDAAAAATQDGHDVNGAAAGASNSPLGKRSFDELADEDEFDLEEPDLKKSRSG